MIPAEPCHVCHRPVLLADRHVAIVRHVETLTGDEIRVHDAEPVAYAHEGCAAGVELVAQVVA